MLNSAYLIFPANVSPNDLKDALIKSGAHSVNEEKVNWIVSASPDRHVRLNVVNVDEYFDLDQHEMDVLTQKLDGISAFGVFVEMSSSEKEGKLAVEVLAKVLEHMGGVLINQDKKYYSPAEVAYLASRHIGFYE